MLGQIRYKWDGLMEGPKSIDLWQWGSMLASICQLNAIEHHQTIKGILSDLSLLFFKDKKWYR